MKAEQHAVQYGQYIIDYTLVRRDRATLEIAVEPDMSVIVAAPMAASIQVIAEKLKKRAAWVRRQQRFFAQFLPRTPERQYVGGETHLYLGRQYRLKIVPSVQAGVAISRGFIVVRTLRPKSSEVTRELVDEWYKMRALAKFSERVEANLSRFPNPEAYRPKAIIVRQLDQRWGSMSSAGRLLLNRRLIHAPVDAIDYVITHELCHRAEPHHGQAFFDLLAAVLPDWPKRKFRLEQRMA
jgi:predicted metal-dependent hydrolase